MGSFVWGLQARERGERLTAPRILARTRQFAGLAAHADREAHVLLFEPAGTLNTGNVRNERTIDEPGRL